jgi:GDPmannose 4,6-dehydratase
MRAFITGVSGQDGSFLAELLLSKGYGVHGLIRRSSSVNQTWRIDHLKQLVLHEGDMTDQGSLARILADVRPDEVYNLAAMSDVAVSFRAHVATCEVSGLGAVRLLEAIRQVGLKDVRYYQASTSELFGSSPPPQNEETPFHPRSPYGAAKLLAHWLTVNAREAYGLHASCGILFNHESGKRSEAFITRKITQYVAKLRLGLTTEKLKLGNLDATRDWGHAKEFVSAMHLMLQQETPGDFVIATGKSHSVRELCDAAFRAADINEWERHVEIDPQFYRPSEVHALRGDASKAARVLGWAPKIAFQELVAEMVKSDLELLGGSR